MPLAKPEPVRINIGDAVQVSGLLQAPPEARTCAVLAHGAGAGMTHPFMAAVAGGLCERGLGGFKNEVFADKDDKGEVVSNKRLIGFLDKHTKKKRWYIEDKKHLAPF